MKKLRVVLLALMAMLLYMASLVHAQDCIDGCVAEYQACAASCGTNLTCRAACRAEETNCIRFCPQ
jgi:hypothetical protein